MFRFFLQRIVIGSVLAASVLSAQTPAVAPTLAFEVATIKPAPPPDPAKMMQGKMHIGMTIDKAQVDIGFLSLADLIPIAYRVKAYQVSGPDWMSAQRFDVMAKLPDGASKDQVPDMLQALLADRFKLVIHHETKEHTVYALVVGKKGSKLKEAPPDAPPDPAANPADAGSADSQRPQMSVSKDGKGVEMKNDKMGAMHMSMGPNGMRMEAEKVAMPDFADMLSRFVGRPVVDMTELKGRYQVALDLTMEDLKNAARSAGMAIPGAGPGGDASKQPADAASDPGGSLFNAVEQLGLKLESRKLPVDLIVVDHLEKAPTEN